MTVSIISYKLTPGEKKKRNAFRAERACPGIASGSRGHEHDYGIRCTGDLVLEYAGFAVKILVVDDLEKFSRSGDAARFDLGPDGQVVVVNLKSAG